MLQNLLSLLSIESYPGEEKEVREFAIAKLKELGFATSVDTAGNLFAERGAAPFVLLNAHMDAVKPYESKITYGGYSGRNNYYNDFEPVSKTLWYKDAITKTTKTKLFKVSDAVKKSCVRCGMFLSCYSSTSLGELEHADLVELEIDVMKVRRQCYTAAYKYSKEPQSRMVDMSEEEEEEIQLALALFEEEKSPVVEVKKKLELKYNETTGKITAPGAYRAMGGDDKCGMAIALELAKTLPRKIGLKILFTVEEEVGCVGAKHAVKHSPEWFSDCSYCLTADRRGGNDICITTGGESNIGTRGYLADLAKYAILTGFVPVFANGSSSDNFHIKYLVPNAINVSCGYYSPHMKDEYVMFFETERTYKWLKNFILRHKRT